jgi:DNA repair exonuclease SbcCD ATPase subunit
LSPPFKLFKRALTNSDQGLQPDTITIIETSELLNRKKEKLVANLFSKIEPLESKLERVLLNLNKIAENLSGQDIKVEDNNFKSLIENTKRTLINSIRRESNLSLPKEQTFEGAKFFSDRLNNLLNRYGEVSGSHSKVINEFMKKHTSKLKDEFGTLSKIQKETTKLITIYEEEINRILDCQESIQKLEERIKMKKMNEETISNLLREKNELEVQRIALEEELEEFKESQEFLNISKTLEKIEVEEKKKHLKRKSISNMFSNISRAVNKYSYSVSKEVQRKLDLMISRPWTTVDDVTLYVGLLENIKKDVSNGKIQVKDYDKTISYFDQIIASLPTYSIEIKELENQLELLRKSINVDTKKKIEEHPKNLSSIHATLLNVNQSIDDTKVKSIQDRSSISDSTIKIENDLYEIFDKRYNLILT